jgi:hypothetical protein
MHLKLLKVVSSISVAHQLVRSLCCFQNFHISGHSRWRHGEGGEEKDNTKRIERRAENREMQVLPSVEAFS